MSDEPLLDRIANRETKVGVVGLGYVGLPLSLSFVEAGFQVRGFDIDDYRVGDLQAGTSYIDDVTDERLSAALESGFEPSTEQPIVDNCDVYILAVPTGMRADEPDMSAVKAAARTVAERSGRRETLVVVSSTVYPGATKEVVTPIVEANRDDTTHFAMVPERLNPGGEYEFSEIPLVVGADSEEAGAAATELFESVVANAHPVDSTETAELAKTLENTYRMVNIAVVNELVTLAEGLDADVWDAIDAAATKPFGFQPFQPGPGVGGHCIPIDPQFLSWRAEELGTDLSLLNGAQRVNERMPALVSERVETALHDRDIDPTEARILALGAAYKPNVGDTRNSPALQVVEALPEDAEVIVADPHTEPTEVARELVRTPTASDMQSADIVVLLVDHDAFDLDAIGEHASLVFDTRDAMPDETDAEVVTLGQGSGETSAEHPTKPPKLESK
ncbi:nucleotide sugar dehydrogenase [Haloarchaeobius sp. FL176]|uniref:nucleotide sugar dehydrogenase n=1 Tax=Haloarchaeobius sp. FL176 TaxID=2967129 RepID=UPI0021473873|nr:nucleotide sugar dehydrogenase [Haloarchaeobius sp. FL176]